MASTVPARQERFVSGRAVLKRLFVLLHIKEGHGSIASLAREMALSSKTLHTWWNRDRVDLDAVCRFCHEHDFDLNHVVRGKDLVLPGGSVAIVGEPPSEEYIRELLEASSRIQRVALDMMGQRQSRIGTGSVLEREPAALGIGKELDRSARSAGSAVEREAAAYGIGKELDRSATATDRKAKRSEERK